MATMSKHSHYYVLDFLRGIAALSVVLFHFLARIDTSGLMGHGYLAVDFFFMLSGYVIENAYSVRVQSGEMNLRKFMLTRAIRLMPMVIVGTFLAAAFDFFRPGLGDFSSHAIEVLICLFLGILLLPVFWSTSLESASFPLNGPIWSLFFETIGNVIHAMTFNYRHRLVAYFVTAVVSLALFFWATYYYGGSFDFGPHKTGFLVGFPRLLWSYMVGVIICMLRMQLTAISKWIYAAVLVSIYLVPKDYCFPYLDILTICLVNPLIIMSASGDRSFYEARSITRLLGELSYPVYALHYPFIRVVGVLIRTHKFSLPYNILLATAGTLLIAVLAYMVYVKIDVPIRSYLQRRVFRSRNLQHQDGAEAIQRS